MNRKWRVLIIFLVFVIAITGCGGKNSGKNKKAKKGGKKNLTELVGTEKIKPDISSEDHSDNSYKEYFPNAISFEEFASYFTEVEINRDNWSDYFEVREEIDPESDKELELYVFASKSDNIICSEEDEFRLCADYTISGEIVIKDPDTGNVIRSDGLGTDHRGNERIGSCKETLGTKYLNYGIVENDGESQIVENVYTLENFTVYDAQGKIYEMNIPEDVWIEKTNKNGQTIRYIDMTDGIVMRRLYENGLVVETSVFEDNWWSQSNLNEKETNMERMDQPLSERISNAIDIDKLKHNVSIENRLAAEKSKIEQYASYNYIPEDVFYNSITKIEINDDNHDDYIEEYVEYVDDCAVVSIEIKDGYFIDDYEEIEVFYENKPNDGSEGSDKKEKREESVSFIYEKNGPGEVKCKMDLGYVVLPRENNHVEVLDIKTSIKEVYSINIPDEYINKDYLSEFEYGYVREFLLFGSTEAYCTLYLDNLAEIIYLANEESPSMESHYSEPSDNYKSFFASLETNDYMKRYDLAAYDGSTEIPKLEDGKVTDNLKNAKNGEIYLFGSYEQNGIVNDGKEPIEWIVCEKKDGYALLLSRYILEGKLDYIAYQGIEPEDRTWENSLKRYFLNEYFYNVAFSEEEKNQIQSVKNNSDDCDAYFKRYDNDKAVIYDKKFSTIDRVFLLSAVEWNTIATELNDKCFTYPTVHSYVSSNDYKADEKYSEYFALRTRAGVIKNDEGYDSDIVRYDGMIPIEAAKGSVYLSAKGGSWIRPAIWVKY